MIDIIGYTCISIVAIIFLMPWICIFIEESGIKDTMSIKEEEKIIKLFKKYGIEQTGSSMTPGDRYKELDGVIGNRNKVVKIEVKKKKFKIVFEIEPDLSIKNELGISSLSISTIKTFNKVFKNGIIEYFEKEIKMKKLENKLKRIEEDF